MTLLNSFVRRKYESHEKTWNVNTFYKDSAFLNTLRATDHLGKLVSDCYFNFRYKFVCQIGKYVLKCWPIFFYVRTTSKCVPVFSRHNLIYESIIPLAIIELHTRVMGASRWLSILSNLCVFSRKSSLSFFVSLSMAGVAAGPVWCC